MRLEGFEPANSVSKQPQTHDLERAATGIGNNCFIIRNYDNFRR